LGTDYENMDKALSPWIERLRPFMKKEYDLRISEDHRFLNIYEGKSNFGWILITDYTGSVVSGPENRELQLCDEDQAWLVKILVRHHYADDSALRFLVEGFEEENIVDPQEVT
jgi:hypothetical protein